MKFKVVLVPFPFDDLSSTKVRPAVCLTDEITPHGHIVLAFITSNVTSMPSNTDLVIDQQDPDFASTGLKLDSTVRLHRLMTVSRTIIRRELGELFAAQRRAVVAGLRKLFQL